MTTALLELVGGLASLLVGGHVLVQGACALARSSGVSPLTIGLTIVAFGTSAPELAVNVTAALRGHGDVAFGNVMGSNLANIGLVLGVAAIVRNLSIQGALVTRELPLLLLASVSTLVMGMDQLRGASVSSFDRPEGLLLLLLFSVFLYATFRAARASEPDPLVAGATALGLPDFASTLRPMASIALGLIALVAGAQLTVAGAVATADHLDLPPVVVSMAIIAVGTSLPELVTCTVAAWHGETDLAVGSVIGSNVFNLLFVLGVTATIRPVVVPAAGGLDLIAMVVMAVLLFIVCSIYGGRGINHANGWLFLACYVGYLAARVE